MRGRRASGGHGVAQRSQRSEIVTPEAPRWRIEVIRVMAARRAQLKGGRARSGMAGAGRQAVYGRGRPHAVSGCGGGRVRRWTTKRASALRCQTDSIGYANIWEARGM